MLEILRELYWKKVKEILPFEARYWQFEVEGSWYMMAVRDKDLYLAYSRKAGTA